MKYAITFTYQLRDGDTFLKRRKMVTRDADSPKAAEEDFLADPFWIKRQAKVWQVEPLEKPLLVRDGHGEGGMRSWTIYYPKPVGPGLFSEMTAGKEECVADAARYGWPETDLALRILW